MMKEFQFEGKSRGYIIGQLFYWGLFAAFLIAAVGSVVLLTVGKPVIYQLGAVAGAIILCVLAFFAVQYLDLYKPPSPEKKRKGSRQG